MNKIYKKQYEKSSSYGQILLDPERKLLDILVKEYDAGSMFFNKHTKSWCIVTRNTNNIIATFKQHMFTLSINNIYYIDELLIVSDINQFQNSYKLLDSFIIGDNTICKICGAHITKNNKGE